MTDKTASGSFRLILHAEPPSDPRGRLEQLEAVTEGLRNQLDRLERGLRIGCREVERCDEIRGRH